MVTPRAVMQDPMTSARTALAAGDTDAATEALLGAAEAGEPTALVRLGGLCMADDDFDAARGHWEIAFRRLRELGDLRAAARVAAELASLHTSGYGNRSAGRGWIERGRRLVRRAGHCVEEGYLALAIVGCDLPDVATLARDAEMALALAAEFTDPVLEARALSESGFALVVQGHLAEGFARLDEAMATVTAGEVSDLAVAGKCFCAMLSACDRCGDVRRAQEWTKVVGEFVARHGDRPRILHTHCRGAYGSLLSSLGRWSEAEQAMLEALAPEASRAMVHRAQTSAHLADLRLRQRRPAEAEVLLAPFEDCLACCAPLARLHLSRGQASMAVAVIERGLAELVGDRLRAAPLLGLLVEAELARDRLDAATDAACRLAALAVEVDIPLLMVGSALASARVATAHGQHGRAIALLEGAIRDLDDHDRPLQSGLVHFERARAWAEAGEHSRAVSEARAALAVFDRLGAVVDADRTAALLRSFGDRGRPRPAGRAVAALSPREREVLELLRQGLTNAEIGQRLYIAAKTAEHHVSSVLTKLGARSRAEAAALASSL